MTNYERVWKWKKRQQESKSTFVRKSYGLLYRLAQMLYGSQIAWNAEFAGMPCLPHGMHGIFISGRSKIGKNCVIFHQVTIGSNSLPDSKGRGAPIIGDNCYIGAGAKIIGGLQVGDNVRIGANCVVYGDVPANSVVVSRDIEVISRSTPLVNKFYTLRNGGWVCFDDGVWIEETDATVLAKLNSIE